MNEHVQDALVTGHEYLIDVLELPDLDDRHVLAAAIHGKADAIVTLNPRFSSFREFSNLPRIWVQRAPRCTLYWLLSVLLPWHHPPFYNGPRFCSVVHRRLGLGL